ncbi:TetR family transcriptional regulator [Nocardia sp. NBC_00565]|uniref:TetR/AcrR family transcriptional regulator n=1 Tax=Nocardia sp. NBC_00565 TaxID=2975993 RepID=UPI002E8203FB|nr:TetR family transcriptional regulator [Nocardia sp. NBC_00565]WUC07551.1 TetR family transcriptional regulator [Nocardia sp. NBC_00565]
MASTATEAAGRGRGRPPRLSRDQIIEAAVELLEREPNAGLTIKRVAEAVGSAQMALYRYFPDRDTLLQAVADHVVAHIRPRPLTGDTWQEQVRDWMRNSSARLRPYSQLLPYMAATRQPVGLRALDRLAMILSPLGLDDEDLALAVILIGSTTIGYASFETHRLPAEQVVAALREGLPLRSEAEREIVEPLLPLLPTAYARLYDTILDQTIATIEALKP